ncbi:hypothetical protein V8F20_001864 [Naviculisporaceae sp. PSN 640]
MSQAGPPDGPPATTPSLGFAATVNNSSNLLYIVLAWFSVASVVVALRVFIRTRLIKNFGWDDAVMVLSMVAYSIFSTVLILIVYWAKHRDEFAAMAEAGSHHGRHGHHGPGGSDQRQHAKEAGNHTSGQPGGGYDFNFHNPVDDLFYSRLLWQIQSLLYLGTISLTRLSIGMLFLRVIPPGTKTWARVITHLLIWLNVVATTVEFFIDLFECRPIGASPGQPGAKCLPLRVFPWSIIIYSILSIIIDFTFAVLPCGFLWGVAMRPGEKAGAIILMGVGCLATITVIWRLTMLAKADFLQLDSGKLKMNPLQMQVDMLISWTIEQSLGIVGGSLATFKPLFTWLVDLYRKVFPPAGITRPRRRPDRLEIPNHFPPPLGSPATPMTPGNNAYARRMAQYQSGQEFELASNGSTLNTTSVGSVNSNRSKSPVEQRDGDKNYTKESVSPAFPEYVRIDSQSALISPSSTRVSTPTTLKLPTFTPNINGQWIQNGRHNAGDQDSDDDEKEIENEIPPSITPRDFGTPLPTIFSGQVLDFSKSQTVSTFQSDPEAQDHSDLFHWMPATLTESTLDSNGSGSAGDPHASPGPTVRYI